MNKTWKCYYYYCWSDDSFTLLSNVRSSNVFAHQVNCESRETHTTNKFQWNFFIKTENPFEIHLLYEFFFLLSLLQVLSQNSTDLSYSSCDGRRVSKITIGGRYTLSHRLSLRSLGRVSANVWTNILSFCAFHFTHSCRTRHINIMYLTNWHRITKPTTMLMSDEWRTQQSMAKAYPIFIFARIQWISVTQASPKIDSNWCR